MKKMDHLILIEVEKMEVLDEVRLDDDKQVIEMLDDLR
jgi:hypothetical protein